MFVYYFSVLSCFFATFLKDKKIKTFILIGLALFLCAGYMCGTDWRNYEYAYNHSSLATVDQELFELGYSYLQAIFHTIGIDFGSFILYSSFWYFPHSVILLEYLNRMFFCFGSCSFLIWDFIFL